MSYIADELLENAMKFTHGPSEYPVTIAMHLDRKQLRFYVTNSVDAEAEQGLRAMIRRLLTEDTNELFIKQLESSGEGRGSGSGLGYLTMINDYGAQQQLLELLALEGPSITGRSDSRVRMAGPPGSTSRCAYCIFLR